MAKNQFKYSSFDILRHYLRKLICCSDPFDKIVERGVEQVDKELDIIRVLKRLR